MPKVQAPRPQAEQGRAAAQVRARVPEGSLRPPRAVVAWRPVCVQTSSCEQPRGSVWPRQPASVQSATGSAGRASGAPPAGPARARHRGFPAPSLASLSPCALGPAAPAWRVLTRTALCGLTLSLSDCRPPPAEPRYPRRLFLPALRTCVAGSASPVARRVGRGAAWGAWRALAPVFSFQLERGDFLSEEWRERIANTRYGGAGAAGRRRAWPGGPPGRSRR